MLSIKSGIRKSFFLLLLLLTYSAFTHVTSANPILPQAAIAMPDQHAARVAQDILNAGGNAVDAAIAAGFALAVTYFEAGNIGGGGFMLIHMDGEPFFLDYRETAPLAADRDMYLDKAGNVIDKASLVGAKAAGVPGTVAGFWAAHQRFGKLPWKAIVAPAIALAQRGFMPSEVLADEVRLYIASLDNATNFERYFGTVKQDEVFRQPELAATLQRIANQGPKDFYQGETAALLVTQMRAANGIISPRDLRIYQAIWREPLYASWREYEIYSAPPPSSGGFGVIQLLKMKDYLADEFTGLSHNSSQYVHLVAEMEKRLFADRAEYLGDPAFIDRYPGHLDR